jgi:SNF2 family DNA or RNA helicase
MRYEYVLLFFFNLSVKKELWSLLNFLEPKKFTSLAQFEEKYGNLETGGAIEQLHEALKPHLLRRYKKNVEKVPQVVL